MQSNGHEQGGAGADRTGGYQGWNNLAEADEMPAEPSAPDNASDNCARAQMCIRDRYIRL